MIEVNLCVCGDVLYMYNTSTKDNAHTIYVFWVNTTKFDQGAKSSSINNDAQVAAIRAFDQLEKNYVNYNQRVIRS